MQKPRAGFEEIEHTADWALKVWAPDLAGLFEQAARGMYALAGMAVQEGERREHQLDLQSPDAESLLVMFLTELLYLAHVQRFVVDMFDLHVSPGNLKATLAGLPLQSIDKEIKAVTYHHLQIITRSGLLEATVVFDV